MENWKPYKGYGVLLHFTALPSDYSTGDIGSSSKKILNWLKKAGANTWQVLPTGIPDKTNCPYACLSAFGGNPLLICIEGLKEMGLLSEDDLSKGVNDKWSLLESSFVHFQANNSLNHPYSDFCSKSSFWLEDLATFLVLTELHGDDWSLWPNQLSNYHSDEVTDFKKEKSEKIEFQKFLQFIFHYQWNSLKELAKEEGINFFGDIPIFVSYHSMEVWKEPNFFKLDSNFKMNIETGAPPDAFSDAGQKWGTPNYNWNEMKEDGFSWWLNRIQYQRELFDILRLDHFLGFVHIWESPKKDPDARNGHWVETPGDLLFTKIQESFPSLPIVAEDLGETNEEVYELRDKYHFPGMKILQFAFGTKGDKGHHPENFCGHEVVYTGTHDNNTTLGHLEDLKNSKNVSPNELESYLNEISQLSEIKKTNWALIDIALQSRALLAIFPIQDLLDLSSEARFNLPGTISPKNWSWRLTDFPTEELAEKIHELAHKHGRCS